MIKNILTLFLRYIISNAFATTSALECDVIKGIVLDEISRFLYYQLLLILIEDIVTSI